MSELNKILSILMEEGGASRAHFHTWWALTSLAIPDYLDTMSDHAYIDFFHVANSGNFKLFFISLSKVYDRDERTAGVSKLKEELRNEGYNDIADEVERRLDSQIVLLKKVLLSIRNMSVSHNQSNITRDEVYIKYGVTPDEIRGLIDITCDTINYVAKQLGRTNVISQPDRHEEAVLNLLRVLSGAQVQR